MKKTVYEIRKSSIELIYMRPEDLSAVVAGCSIYDDPEPELIKRFEDRTEALETFADYKSEFSYMHYTFHYIYVYEYALFEEELEIDEEGEEEYVDCSELIALSPMPEEIRPISQLFRYSKDRQQWEAVEEE